MIDTRYKYRADDLDNDAGMGEKMSGAEMHVLENLVLLNATMKTHGDALLERIRGDKQNPRMGAMYQCLRTYLDKITNRVGRLGSESDLMHMNLLAQYGTVNITMKRAVRVPNYVYVQGKMMDVLVKTCIAERCQMCIADKHTVRNCKLRKAMQEIAPVMEKPVKDRCEYSDYVIEEEYLRSE